VAPCAVAGERRGARRDGKLLGWEDICLNVHCGRYLSLTGEVMRSLRLAFIGPIATPSLPARGGFQAANRNTIDELRRRQISVAEFRYPEPTGNKLTKALGYLRGFISLSYLVWRQEDRWDIAHVTPLYKYFIYYEIVLLLLLKLLRKKILLDIRAGSAKVRYERGSFLYRFVFRSALRLADGVSVEGEGYVGFVHRFKDGRVLYFPNYVRTHNVASPSGRSMHPIKLVFLGRVTPEKGIEAAIEIGTILHMDGYEIELFVIGSGNTKYLDLLKERYPFEWIKWVGALSQHDVREKIRDCHFFLFPTRHYGEGHSNALTEAMAEGLVPVCSDAGFNRSVVAKAGIVLPVLAVPEEYASSIEAVWRNKEWPSLSHAACDRVRRLYSADVVIPRLIQRYYEIAGFTS
jgi:glycosyltransferase involved in cell wall biosynthesis